MQAAACVDNANNAIANLGIVTSGHLCRRQPLQLHDYTMRPSWSHWRLQIQHQPTQLRAGSMAANRPQSTRPRSSNDKSQRSQSPIRPYQRPNSISMKSSSLRPSPRIQFTVSLHPSKKLNETLQLRITPKVASSPLKIAPVSNAQLTTHKPETKTIC